MRVGDAEPVQDALDAAILAEAPVQGVEHHIGLRVPQRLDQRGGVLAHLDAGDLVPRLFQRGGALRAGGQRDLPLRRNSPQKDGDACH